MESKNLPANDPLALAGEIIRILDNKKAYDLRLLHVHDHTMLADYFVICSGNSSTQVKGLSGELEFQMTEKNCPPAHIEGYNEGTWILHDYSSVIVHIFNNQTRRFYNLEKLWSEAKELDIAPFCDRASHSLPSDAPAPEKTDREIPVEKE